jgi:hypothetical protein
MQIAATQKKSTGPRTLEGESHSDGNALKHGLCSGFRVLQAESQEEFDELIARFHRDFAPTNVWEESLVEEMVHSCWRLARARRIEARIVDAMLAASSFDDSDSALISALFNNNAGPFIVIQRYIAAAERAGRRAHKQLLAIRRQEAQNKAQAAREAAVPNEPNSRPARTPARVVTIPITPCEPIESAKTPPPPETPGTFPNNPRPAL